MTIPRTCLAACLLCCTLAGPAFAKGDAISQIDLRDITVGDALRMLSDQSGQNVIASEKAAKIKTALFLRDVKPRDVLDALAKAYNLWYQEDPASRIIRVYTVDEFRLGQVDSAQEQTRIYTLRYPNAVDVAYAIHDLFGKRVVMNLGTNQQEVIRELSSRFQRFNMVDSQSQHIGGTQSAGLNQQGGGQYGGTQFGGGLYGGNAAGGSPFGGGSYGGGMYGGNQYGGGQYGGNYAQGTGGAHPNISTDELFSTGKDVAKNEAASSLFAGEAQQGQEVMQRLSPVYVTVIRSQNRIVARSRDPEVIQQISELVQKLDINQSSLLLEVKLLSIDLSDNFEALLNASSIDINNLAHTAYQALLPGAGSAGSALLATFVNDQVTNKLKLAQQENRVTALATPVLVTTNQEVSRLFLGKEVPITTGFDSYANTTSGVFGTNITYTLKAKTETRPIGTSLLLTPNINADRSVTIRMVVEQSDIIKDGATIPIVSQAATFDQVPVDIVTTRNFSGTIVGQDRQTIAVGGLIEESVGDHENKIPLLGDIPLLGILFREDNRDRSRKELIVLLRPMVQITPSESAGNTQEFLENGSIHPKAPEGGEPLNIYRNEPANRNGYQRTPQGEFRPLD